MVIAHNMASMFTERQLGITNFGKSKSTEKLSSGYRINRAADDAAGLSISEKMRSQIRGLNRAAENVQDGISLCRVAEGALQNVHDILQRMRELTVQAANEAVYTPDDLQKIDDEITSLKKEINAISRDTEFNKKTLFCTDYELGFSGNIIVVSIFDATNGDPNDPNSYGGIIVKDANGKDLRVPWSTISSDMVYTDATTGETLFKAGTYTYNTGKCTLTISCEDGSKPPEIKTEFSVEATSQGISIAGDIVPWSDIVNEDGDSILNHIGESGYYMFSYGDAEGGVYIPDFETLDDVVKGINQTNSRYARHYVNTYSGYSSAQAVDIQDSGSSMKVSNTIFNAIQNNNDLDAILKADTSGIWIVDAAGNEIANSKKTWADLGLSDWSQGTDVSDAFTYRYVFQDADYNIQFNFNLLNETSLDSVIDGINNAHISDTNVTTSTTTELDFTGSSIITDGKITYQKNNLNIYEEADLGRNFDVQTQTIAAENMDYDAAANTFNLDYADSTANDVISYHSTSLTDEATVTEKAKVYQSYLTALEVKKLLRGDANLATGDTLTTVIGVANVTQDGYMSKTVTIDTSQMRTTSSLANNKTYPAASIDFSGLGTQYELKDLLGTGFNSTCKTCSKHYSVLFVYGGTEKVSSEGYGYTKSDDGKSNYTLQIDLKSMMDKGITDAADFTNALIDVLDDSNFDFHYTQYAADGGTLYICDDRSQSTPAKEATFDTNPYQVGEGTITMKMQEDNGSRSFNLEYTYKIDSASTATVTMKNDASGNYVLNDNGVGYREFDANNSADLLKTRYSVEITNGTTDWAQYYDDVMDQIAKESKIQLNSTDYDYVKYQADENDNSATVSNFDFKIEQSKKEWIQSGANSLQGFYMVWDGFNTATLGISKPKVTDGLEACSSLFSKIDNAIATISSTRSIFGSYENRMEHAYNYNKNTEENLQDAESRIRDTDMAEEMVRFSKQNLLEQVGISILTQANQASQQVLTLLG